MSQGKLAETKNQHYVPQFYQRFFSADENQKTIGTYVIGQRKYISKASIKNQSSGDYFYSANPKIEEALGMLEALASKVISKIITNPKDKLSKEDWASLYVFTFMQIGRTQDRVNFIQESIDKMTKMLLKKYIEVEKNSEREDDVKMLTDEVVDSMVISLSEPGLFTLGNHAQIVNTCVDLQMKILINKTGFPFISTDNPACMYSMFMERVGESIYAFGSKGLMFYMPLSKDIAVMYYDSQCYKIGGKRKDYVEVIQKEDVDNLNILTSCYADKILYCLDGSIGIDVLENYSNIRDKFRPEERTETVDGLKTIQGEIVGTFTNSIYCKLKLSFVTELSKSKAITKDNYNPYKDRLRPIAYMKEELVKRKTIKTSSGQRFSKIAKKVFGFR